MNADAESYMREIVDPTIADFRDHSASQRRAFLACAATFHCIDYIALIDKSQNLRQRFRKESSDFATVDRVAHAFKHVESGSPKSYENQPLRIASVFARPPALAGIMQCGLSRFGDLQGGVEIWNEDGTNLLRAVTMAADFLRSKM
jgi:hypothetical protein